MAEPITLSSTDALVQASFLIQGTLEQRGAERGLSLIQMRLLGVLRDREPTINELSALLGLDKSSVSGLVDRAERRKMVARRPSERDRRSVQVRLTLAGREAVDAVAGHIAADLVAVLAPLTAREREILTTLLSRILFAQADLSGIDRDRNQDGIDLD